MKPTIRVAVLLVAALLSAACGARLTPEQYELATARGSDGQSSSGSGTGGTGAGSTGSGTGSTGSGTGAGTGTGATGAGTGTGAGTDAGAGTDTGGTGGGTGEGTGTGGAAATCTPQPSDEVGVTDTEVAVGNISTISGAVPGFGTTGRNAVQAYFAMVNATGGVCGRQLRLVLGDDGLDAGRNRAETQRMVNEVIGFAGGTTVVDDGGADILNGTNIPDVALTIGARRTAMENNYSPNPLDPAVPGNGAAFQFAFYRAQNITSAAVVWPDQADARSRGQGFVADLQAAGFTDIRTFQTPIAESNYASVAQEIKNAGSQLVVTTLEVSMMAGLAKGFAAVNYRPQVPFYGAQAYGQQFINLAGTAAEGAVALATHALFDDPVPAMQDFLTWYGRVAPNSSPDFFAIQGWASADIFVQALRAAGGAPTRDAMIAHLNTMTAYDGGGFMAPRNLPDKQNATCFVITTVQNGRWVRTDPATGFRC